MIKFENVVTPSPKQWRSIIMGARNPMNSWDRSDSDFTFLSIDGDLAIGPNDLDLMNRLRHSGTDHRKFMRMITVYVDITAPLYWWKEFDTYKIATVSNSCSTMHKIHAKEFTLEDFSCDHLTKRSLIKLQNDINELNFWRDAFNCKKDEYRAALFASTDWDDAYVPTKKDCWWQMIQLLPSSYNQKRTVMMNYEVLANIYKSRKNHRLDEWAAHSSSIPDSPSQALYSKDLPFGFCDWIKTLPYSELITGEHFLTHDEIMEKLDKWAKDAKCEV